MNKPGKVRLNHEQMLENFVVDLEAKNMQLKNELVCMTLSNKELKNLQIQYEKIERENVQLRDDIKIKELEWKNKIWEIEMKYNNEIYKLKKEISINNHKYQFLNGLENYMISLESINKLLELQIKNLEEDSKSKLDQQNLLNKTKIDILNKKTLSIIKSTKNIAQTNAVKNLNESCKVTLLQNINLNSELSDQSKMLEDLLKKLDIKDKEIRNLKYELEIHKEVEIKLTKFNRKTVEIIQELMKKMDESDNFQTKFEAARKLFSSKITSKNLSDKLSNMPTDIISSDRNSDKNTNSIINLTPCDDKKFKSIITSSTKTRTRTKSLLDDFYTIQYDSNKQIFHNLNKK